MPIADVLAIAIFGPGDASRSGVRAFNWAAPHRNFGSRIGCFGVAYWWRGVPVRRRGAIRPRWMRPTDLRCSSRFTVAGPGQHNGATVASRPSRTTNWEMFFLVASASAASGGGRDEVAV